MRLIVRPRYAVNSLDLDVRHAVISISDPPPYGEPARLNKCWGQEAVGRWAFWDLDETYAGDHAGLMQPQQAEEIWAFVHEWKEKVEAFVIHCEAGASRSPSIAMALADRLWDRAFIEWKRPSDWDINTRAAPNVYVYDRMMSAATAGEAGGSR